MANYTAVFVVLAGVSSIGLLTALGGLFILWNDATVFYEDQLQDVYTFNHYSNDAWQLLIAAHKPATGKKTSVGRSPLLHRSKRDSEDVCACAESAQLCPPGAPGEPGVPGAPGVDGDRGSPGMKGADYETLSPTHRHSNIKFHDIGRTTKHCFTCPAGAPGCPGPNGKTGNPGRPGKPGHRGLPGRHGTKGEKGEIGDPGVRGKSGPSGISGQPGQNGIKGHGAPGRPGQKGSRGSRGSRGTPGLSGKNGAVGPAGLRGPSGLVGISGLNGASGPEGFAGLPGKDSDYCLCPERKDKSSDQGGSTTVPYLLKVDVAVPNNYKRRETTIAESNAPSNTHNAVTTTKQRHSRRGFGKGRRNVQERFLVTEFADGPISERLYVKEHI